MGAGDDGLAARTLQTDESLLPPRYMWRGSLLPLGRAAALKLLRLLRSRTGASSLATRPASNLAQSSRAFTDLGDSRKLRRLRLTLLRWLTRLGPRAMATPIANTSITTRWAIRDVSGV
ncbi:hypothetical protein PS838_01416 [Pseudomonas fluorescens]|nr:hypothetical protein PS838_01416 [Pseudomonas fluorescens]